MMGIQALMETLAGTINAQAIDLSLDAEHRDEHHSVYGCLGPGRSDLGNQDISGPSISMKVLGWPSLII